MSLIKIKKTGTSIDINGSTYNVNQIKCSNYGSEIRVEHRNSVILDRTLYSNIEYNGAILASANDLTTLATNLTS